MLIVARGNPLIDLNKATFELLFSGLGLSLCRSVIEAHGGTIRLSSQVGQGTTVHITLPLAPPADVQASEPPDAAEASEPPRRGRILLIDDEATVRRALQHPLERSGHNLALAANGREGPAALQGRTYDVILCDIRMPDLDGPGFYREVTRVYPHLVSRMVFLTGDVLSPEVQAFFDQAGCLRLVKPFQASGCGSSSSRCWRRPDGTRLERAERADPSSSRSRVHADLAVKREP